MTTLSIVFAVKVALFTLCFAGFVLGAYLHAVVKELRKAEK